MLKKIAENKMIILLFITFIVIYLIAWNRGLKLLYVISELSLATLILSLIAPYLNLLGIKASIKYPKYTEQAKGLPITIELLTSGFFDKYLLEIWLKTPFSTNRYNMFFVTTLHKKILIKSDIFCDVRGVHQVGPIHIQTGFPLGLKVFKKTFEATKGEIVVFPTPLKVKNFPMSIDESSVLLGDKRSKKRGGHDEFVSVREYKHGDSPRYIHWAISAKKGKLIVKEYQELLSSNLIIILDLNRSYNVGKLKDTTLEYAITIASSLAIYGLDKGFSVSLFGYGKKEIKLLNLKGLSNKTKILKALATAKSDGDNSYIDTIEYFLALQRGGGTLVLFDNGSTKVEKNIDSYISRIKKPVLFDIDAKSFKKSAVDTEFRVEHYQKYIKYSLKKGCDIERMLS